MCIKLEKNQFIEERINILLSKIIVIKKGGKKGKELKRPYKCGYFSKKRKKHRELRSKKHSQIFSRRIGSHVARLNHYFRFPFRLGSACSLSKSCARNAVSGKCKRKRWGGEGGMTKKKEPTGGPSLEMEVEWMTVKAKRGKGDEMKWLEEGE